MSYQSEIQGNHKNYIYFIFLECKEQGESNYGPIAQFSNHRTNKSKGLNIPVSIPYGLDWAKVLFVD